MVVGKLVDLVMSNSTEVLCICSCIYKCMSVMNEDNITFLFPTPLMCMGEDMNLAYYCTHTLAMICLNCCECSFHFSHGIISLQADAEAEVKKVCIYMGGFASMCRKLIDDNWDNLWDLVREKLVSLLAQLWYTVELRTPLI